MLNSNSSSLGKITINARKPIETTSAPITPNPMLAAVYVYSGECKLGKIGEPTALKDFSKRDLFVGDIVIASTIDNYGICSNYGLSVVVSDEYNNKLISEENWGNGHFVMGIKNVDFMGKDAETWIVQRVKSFKDVVAGEHWSDYGFNYRAV
jgi:hypothetical protein